MLFILYADEVVESEARLIYKIKRTVFVIFRNGKKGTVSYITTRVQSHVNVAHQHTQSFEYHIRRILFHLQ